MRALPPILLALLLGGCASTASYRTFASAGTSYAARLAEVLAAAERAGVDATSWRLLDNDALSPATAESYAELAEIDRERARVLRLLRHHGDTLARYFGALGALASSTAPAAVGEQLGQAHGALETAWKDTEAIGDALRTNVVFPPAAAVSETSKVVVGQVVRGVLEEELTRRGDAIAAELALHEALLASIARAIDHDLALGAAVAERLLVIDPLLADEPVRDPGQWLESRRAILLAEQTVTEVQAARAAARALRESFEALVSGGTK